MRTETVEITYCTFDELSDDAKQTAINWWRKDIDYSWQDENNESLKVFRQIFYSPAAADLEGVDAVDYLQTMTNNGELLAGNAPLTGYHMDEVLLDCVREFMTKPEGTIKELIDSCVQAFLDAAEKDEEHYFSDESAEDSILAAGYEFDINGNFLV